MLMPIARESTKLKLEEIAFGLREESGRCSISMLWLLSRRCELHSDLPHTIQIHDSQFDVAKSLRLPTVRGGGHVSI